jgi:hypothetical protein
LPAGNMSGVVIRLWFPFCHPAQLNCGICGSVQNNSAPRPKLWPISCAM